MPETHSSSRLNYSGFPDCGSKAHSHGSMRRRGAGRHAGEPVSRPAGPRLSRSRQDSRLTAEKCLLRSVFPRCRTLEGRVPRIVTDRMRPENRIDKSVSIHASSSARRVPGDRRKIPLRSSPKLTELMNNVSKLCAATQCFYLRLRLRAHQLGWNVGIQKESAHSKSIGRAKEGFRRKRVSTSSSVSNPCNLAHASINS